MKKFNKTELIFLWISTIIIVGFISTELARFFMTITLLFIVYKVITFVKAENVKNNNIDILKSNENVIKGMDSLMNKEFNILKNAVERKVTEIMNDYLEFSEFLKGSTNYVETTIFCKRNYDTDKVLLNKLNMFFIENYDILVKAFHCYNDHVCVYFLLTEEKVKEINSFKNNKIKYENFLQNLKVVNE
jgi:hypothetical protein